MKKKILSMIVAAAMCISLLPIAAFADTTGLVVGSETVRFEAEDFVPSGNRVADDRTPSRFSNEKAAGSIAVNAEITAENAGIYDMTVKWGNKFGDNRNVELKVNDKVLFSGQTGITYTYQEQSFSVELKEGTNTVSLTSPDNNLGNFRLDYFEFTPAQNVVTLGNETLRLEGEDYNSNEAGTVEEISGFSGGKRILNPNISISVYNTAEAACNITIKWGTRDGNGNSTFRVNGEVISTMPNGYWKNLDESFIITLPAGINSIEVPKGGTKLWVDYIEIAPIKNLVNLAAGETIKLEAEDFSDAAAESTNTPYNYSGGKRILNGNFEANVYVEAAGTYEIKAAWGAKDGNHSPAVIVNGTSTDVKSTFAYWKTGVKHANVTLSQGINNIKIAAGTKLWVDYIKISPVPTLSSSSPLRLEAEDYTGSSATSTRFFDNGNGIAYNNNNPIHAEFVVAEAGDYIMTLVSGGINEDSPEIAVSIDSEEVYSVSSGATTSTGAAGMTEEAVAPSQTTVTLSAGTHTLDITMPLHGAVDYVEFSTPADYYTEMYPYYLDDIYVDGEDLLAALDKTYLGDYTGDGDETVINTAVKALGSDMAYVYWPFATAVDSNYFLKVTYASANDSDASVIVDPETLPSSSSKDYATVSASGDVVSAGTWQKAYSNDADGFYAPYFTEKIFDIGRLSAGDHNFVFMYDQTDGTNEGLAIRKVELISSDRFDSILYASEAQFAAEAVGASDADSTAKLVSTVSEANEYSSDSVNDADTNTTTVVKYVYNNSTAQAAFTFIAAAYDDDDRLIGVDMSDAVTLSKGQSEDFKVKVSTEGATYIKTFGIDMSTLKPVLEGDLFGK